MRGATIRPVCSTEAYHEDQHQRQDDEHHDDVHLESRCFGRAVSKKSGPSFFIIRSFSRPEYLFQHAKRLLRCLVDIKVNGQRAKQKKKILGLKKLDFFPPSED